MYLKPIWKVWSLCKIRKRGNPASLSAIQIFTPEIVVCSIPVIYNDLSKRYKTRVSAKNLYILTWQEMWLICVLYVEKVSRGSPLSCIISVHKGWIQKLNVHQYRYHFLICIDASLIWFKNKLQGSVSPILKCRNGYVIIKGWKNRFKYSYLNCRKIQHRVCPPGNAAGWCWKAEWADTYKNVN